MLHPNCWSLFLFLVLKMERLHLPEWHTIQFLMYYMINYVANIRKSYSKEWYPSMKFKVLKEKSSSGSIFVECNTNLLKKFKKKDSCYVLPKDYWDFIPKDVQLEVPRRSKVMLSPSQIPYMFHVHFHAIFMSILQSIIQSAVSDMNQGYKRLVDTKSKMDVMQHPPELHSKNSPSRGASPSISGLRWVKDVVLCKRTDHVCRMTVVGDPNVRLSEIGIPEEISKHLVIPEGITSHNKHIWNSTCNKYLNYRTIYARRNSRLCSLTNPVELQIGDVLYRPLENGDLLLVNRPPSVHQHSLIGLSARILPTTAVFSINPLCCAPLYGDFDGDCLHAYVPQSIHSRVELNELVHLNKQLLNGQDSRSLVPLSQDSLTAAYLLTGDMVFLSTSEIQQLQMPSTRSLQYPAILKAPHLTGPLWTGQQLFSAILPENMEFSLPSMTINISNGEVLVSPTESLWLGNTSDGLFSKISRCYGDKALDYFFSAAEILCEWISMRGLSVSLEDMYLVSNSYDRKKLILEVEYGLREADRACYTNNLLMNAEIVDRLKDCNGREEIPNSISVEIHRMLNCKRMVTNSKSFAVFREVFTELQYLVREFASKNNSLLSMIRAGSKGSLSKFLEQSVLSCANWNQYKMSDLHGIAQETSDHTRKCGSYAVIKSSFLDGLNPLECFLHSSSGRMNLFNSEKFLWAASNQFSYDIPCKTSVEDAYCETPVQGGQPIGALAACSISEAAYSALELPSNNAEASPLLNLKKVFECGKKGVAAGQTVSLVLSQKLRRWDYGCEYAALKLQQHLERVLLSDVVSTVLIFYAGQNAKMGTSPWITHFHVNKERLLKERLNLKSISDALDKKHRLSADKSSTMFPELHISRRYCSDDGIHEDQDMENCITVTAENSRFPVDLDDIRNTVIPLLLRTAVKVFLSIGYLNLDTLTGYLEVKKVDIRWDDQRSPRLYPGSSGLFLKVILSESCKAGKGWSFLQEACLPLMDLIDWQRSHPDSNFAAYKAYGVDAAWKYFVANLKIATVKIGKRIHMEHLHLVADCLSATGEFYALTARGLKLQRDPLSLSTPFMQGFFSSPESNFINAAKKGAVDHLLGSVDAMAWGKEAPLGTTGPFELLYSRKVPNLGRQESVYQSLRQECASQDKGIFANMVGASQDHRLPKKQDDKLAYDLLRPHIQDKRITTNGSVGGSEIRVFTHLFTSLRKILHAYPMGAYLKEEAKSLAVKALGFHPRKDAKIGAGIKEIKIGQNPMFPGSRCFVVERVDGTSDDFSYWKCFKGAMEKTQREFFIFIPSVDVEEGKGSNPSDLTKWVFLGDSDLNPPFFWLWT
ncbi:unnamed protein product [Spirodela intermedia]|uniref:DNA-directed RNA polymerase n=1 Tax=Spirodela intermedia TaxID=51605 RepID=A0A7I8IF31_SPIIN|nr:unnamed protein product [Spirodela intermedia]CAA6656289.1 unnamed protein product [Spirodela intermedia]